MESRIGNNGSGIVGKVIEFDYPHTTDRRVDARLRRYERRRVRVEAVRDLESEPLDPLTIEQNPYLTRSGLLVTGLDLDVGESRSFYTGSMVGGIEGLRVVEVVAFPCLRIFIDDSHGRRMIELADGREHFSRYFCKLNPGAVVLPVGRRATDQPISSATRNATAS